MKLLMTIGLLMAMATSAYADKEMTPPAQHFVEMWNKDPNDKSRRMIFSQEIVTIDAGDSVTWLATDKGHNVQFIGGPAGAKLPEKSKLNKDVTITFDTPGVYVYVCTPHATMGMIGVVVVGEATPKAIDQAADAKVRGKSKKKLEELLATL